MDLESKAKVLELHVSRGKQGALTASECSSQPTAPPLHKLQPIGIGDLKPGKHHIGCALFGTLCAEPFQTQAAHTVLEDVMGRTVLLSVYNVVLSSTSVMSLKQRFPIGMKVVIKEPLLRLEKGGVMVLRVDNLLNFEKVSVLPDAKGEFPPPRLDGTDAAAFLKAEGNKLFTSKDWLGAAESYSRCITSCSLVGPAAAAVYSNRAEVWIRVGNFEQALADSNNALKLDASNVKSLCRKARALHGLHEFELALTCMKKVVEMSRDNTGGLLQQLDASSKQSKSGIFDITNFLIGGRVREKAPPCADYVGPVALRKSSMAGRGLFTTEAVKAGDILLVSNALAVSYGDSGAWQTMQDDLVTKIMAVLLTSRRSLQQVNSLLSPSSKTPSLDLFRPNMKFYSESFDTDNNEQRFEPESIRRLVKENAFGQFVCHRFEGLFPNINNADKMMSSNSCGLWPLPSFINHSCLPNASRLEVGKAMFVHAARDIPSGEEITLPYFDTLVPLPVRQDMFQRWGPQCQCRRCAFERALQKPLKKINDHFTQVHEKAFKEINAAAQAGVEFPASLPACSNFAQLGVKIQAEASASITWLRSSYALAYLAGFPSNEFFDDMMTKIPGNDELISSFHETVPGHWRTLIMQSVELMILREYVERDKWDEGIMRTTKQLAYTLCRSTFGNQSVEVYDALIAQASKVRPF